MRVLIVKTSSMGDIVHTLPAVTDLINNKPNIIIDWVVEQDFTEIPRYHKSYCNIIPISLRRWRKNLFKVSTYKELFAFIQNIRKNKYDYIIDAQGLLKSAIITRLATSNNRHGLDQLSARGKYITWAYNKTYNIDKNLHAIYRVKLLFSKVFGYDYSDSIDYGVNLNNVTNTLLNGNETSAKPYLVFLHCTTWTSKKWPVKSWQSLIKKAIANGYSVKLNSGNSQEYQDTQALVAGLELDKQEINTVHTVEAMPPQSISNLLNIIAGSSGVVCVDTGLGHLAAALDKPGVGIYGSTSPKLTSILSHHFINLAAEYTCAPCFLRECKLSTSYPPCYDTLTVNTVWVSLASKISEQ